MKALENGTGDSFKMNACVLELFLICTRPLSNSESHKAPLLGGGVRISFDTPSLLAVLAKFFVPFTINCVTCHLHSILKICRIRDAFLPSHLALVNFHGSGYFQVAVSPDWSHH